MKKLLLGLGTLSLAALPVMAVVSCGTINDGTTLKTKPEFDKIVDSETLEIIDLGITAKQVDQSVITAAIQSITDTPTEDNKITALSTVFDGITADNFNNFDGTFPGSFPYQEIHLTAKPGFSFGGQQTLTSYPLLVDLGITAKLVDKSIVAEAISSIVKAPTDDNKIAALSTVFDGITADNFNNFDGTWRGPEGAQVIYLTAKPEFSFGTSKVLTSIINSPITAKPVTQSVINDAIYKIEHTWKDSVKIKALSKVFDGVTTETFYQFDGTFLGTTPNQQILLTAKQGFIFGGQPTLISTINSPITVKPALQSVITEAIKSIEQTPTDDNKIRALSTVFDGITTENFPRFDEAFLGTAPNQQIHLTAKSGFTFGGQQTLTSYPIVNKLPISRKWKLDQIVINVATGIINNPNGTSEFTLFALQHLFDGITADNMQNFDIQAIEPVETTPTETIPGKVILKAKEGFVFNRDELVLTTDFVAPDHWMQISARPNLQSEITKVANLWWDYRFNVKPYDRTEWLTALQTIFYGITEENFDNFTVLEKPQGSHPNEVIVLTAKAPYLFSDGSPTITSQVGTPDTWINITAKPVSQETIEKFVRIYFEFTTTPDDVLVAIQEIFNGITEDNFDKFEIDMEQTYPDGIVKLTAKAPYSFNGKPTILSKAV